MNKEIITQHYGGVFEEALLTEIAAIGVVKELPAGSVLLDIGNYIRSVPLVISGAIKILREDAEGNELLLYFLEKGETCSITMSCCMGQTKSNIRAVAETDTTLVMIPVSKMEQWSANYKSWRYFIFGSYHNRINELLQTVDSIAFSNMDTRLTHYLKEKSRIGQSPLITNTHKEIAYDLNSSRVVISRLLKKLENQGKIELNRTAIRIIDL